MLDLSLYLNALDDNPFEEIPVDLDTFIGKDYLGEHFVLSPIQRDLVECMSQIFTLEDCTRIYGHTEGIDHYRRYTKKEVILQLGKGSGKDFSSTVGCAYLIYKLLCLKDPARYFGKVSGDAIDIINIAINAEQAKNVFFKGFLNRIGKAPWFQGKFVEKISSVEFDKSITLYSGHSEKESHEGLNLILAILDEISGFSQTNTSGNLNAKTGEAIYSAFRGSVDSRFPDYGKVVLLSFPRYKGDFISEHYERMIKNKQVITKKHTYVVDVEKAPTEDNVFEIEWEEDIITDYVIPNKIYAVKAPSWEVNPGRSIEDYKDAFILNPNDAYQRFACKPAAISDGLFRDEDALRDRMMIRNPVDELRRLEESWKPKEGVTYYLHADLAQKQDRAAVAMAHVDGWVNMGRVMDYEQIQPVVVVDFVAWWDPQRNMPIDLGDVADWIIGLKRRGIKIGRVTTDRWNSLDFQKQLNSIGIKSDTLSVARREYDDLVLTVYDKRVILPSIEILVRELTQLKIINDKKVDHPRSGCFVGETRIPLLDGTYHQISELVGQEVHLYSATPDGKIVPGVGRGRLTKHVSDLVDVVLDSGYMARCTPEHLWMLRDGSYREARHLRPGIDRLMPIAINDTREVETVIPVHLDAPVPVYDLEVDEYDNFALSGGVFVHNSKDLADAVAGAVHNAIAWTPRGTDNEIDVKDLSSIRAERRLEEVKEEKIEIPMEINQWLERMRAL